MPKLTYGKGITGIDLGIKTLATQSNGINIPNPKCYVNSQKTLTKLLRRLAKKCKGSKNREKARLKVARAHLKIANQRQDYIHKLTRQLVNDNQVIVIEDLKVANMGKNHKLAKRIMDVGFGMFRRFLEYKVVESSWCRLIIADRFYPSTQLCSACGTIHGRDENASQNLKGLATERPDLWKDLPGKVILAKNYKELIVA